MMVICELCGSANNEVGESCRVCGQALKNQTRANAPVAATSVPGAALHSWPTGSAPQADQQRPADPLPAAALQMSAVKQALQTGVPPMMNDRQDLEPPAPQPQTTSVPGFMQSSRASSQQESVQLISADDLPDWIRQIAAADEARAAEAQTVADLADPAASIVRRPLPGETHVGGPSTTWLSKSAAAPDSNEHWGAAEAANAHWGSPGSFDVEAQAADRAVAASAPVFVPSSAETYAYPTSKKRFSMPARSSSPATRKPVYRRQLVQLLTIAVLLVVLVLLFI